MAKKLEFDEENKSVTFTSNFNKYDDANKVILIACSYPGVKKLGIKKTDKVEVTIKKKNSTNNDNS